MMLLLQLDSIPATCNAIIMHKTSISVRNLDAMGKNREK